MHCVHAVTVRTTVDVHGVPVTVIALPRKVSNGVAVHTARIVQYAKHSFEISGPVVRCALFCSSRTACGDDKASEDCKTRNSNRGVHALARLPLN